MTEKSIFPIFHCLHDKLLLVLLSFLCGGCRQFFSVFVIYCLVITILFIVKLKTQLNSIPPPSHTHTRSHKQIYYEFFSILIATCYFSFSVLFKLFLSFALLLSSSPCVYRTLSLFIIDNFCVFVRGTFFFWVRVLFFIVIWLVVFVIVMLPLVRFERMDVVPLNCRLHSMYHV